MPWNLYLPHREFLERFDADLLVDERDKDAYSDAFTRLSEAYLRELEPQQAMVRICCVSVHDVPFCECVRFQSYFFCYL